MTLHQLHVTIYDGDLIAPLQAVGERLGKVEELSARIEAGQLALSGRVKQMVTVSAELQIVPQVAGDMLTLEIVRVDAAGPMGALLLPMLLGQVSERYGEQGVTCAGRTITIDLVRALGAYGWTARIDASALNLRAGAAELQLSGEFSRSPRG